MAGPNFMTPNYMKRSATEANLESGTGKKRRIHHRRIHHKQAISNEAALTPPNNEAIESLLARSLGLALQDAGYDAADPVAIESFRSKVETYMLHFLNAVTQSMLCCRRSHPTPQDFVHALAVQNLTINSLEPYLRSSIPFNISQPSLPTPPLEQAPELQLSPLLGAELSGLADKKERRYVPRQFPSFPSKHTYMHTPEWTQREKDPRKIREKATEEGRLGEEALRRLASAATAGGARQVAGVIEGGRSGQRRREREEMWERTLEAVLQPMVKPRLTNGDVEMDDHDSGPFGEVNGGMKSRVSKADLRILVNCESPYWRKDVQLDKPRARQKSSSRVGLDPPRTGK